MPIASLPRTRRDHDAHRSGRLDAHQQARPVTEGVDVDTFERLILDMRQPAAKLAWLRLRRSPRSPISSFGQ